MTHRVRGWVVLVVPTVVAIASSVPMTVAVVKATFSGADVPVSRQHGVPWTGEVHLEEGDRRVIAVADRGESSSSAFHPERAVRVTVRRHGHRVDVERVRKFEDMLSAFGEPLMPLYVFEAPAEGRYRIRVERGDGARLMTTALVRPFRLPDWVRYSATAGSAAAIVLFLVLGRAWLRARRGGADELSPGAARSRAEPTDPAPATRRPRRP